MPLLLSLVVSFLIVLPIVNLVVSSFTTIRLGERVGFTMSNYYEAYTDKRFLPSLVNSFAYATGSAILGLAFAVPMAWIVTRTNFPLRRFATILPLVPLLMPPMMDNIAWIFLLAPRSGILNRFITEFFSAAPVLNAFSLGGMIWVFGLSLVPIMYLIVLPAFLTADRSFEEAAYLSGAGSARTAVTITLPLALPSILSALLVGMLHGMTSFETPTLQGIPGRVPVFVSLIYEAIEIEFNFGLGLAFSSLLIVLSLVLVWLYLGVTWRSEKFAALTGRGVKPRVFEVGRMQYATVTFVLAYFTLAVVLPVSVVLIASVIPTFTYETFTNFPQYLTTSNYATVLRNPTFMAGLVNSLYIGMATAIATVIAAAAVSYVIYRSRLSGGRILEAIGTIPLAFPGLVLSLGLLLAYFNTPFYGNVAGILLAFLVYYFPYASRISSGAIVRVHKEMDEAARTHGASTTVVFWRITLPLLKPALVAGLFLIFVGAYRQVGAAVLLAGPNVSYGAVTLFQYYRRGLWMETAAGSVIYALILLAIVLVARYGFRIKPEF